MNAFIARRSTRRPHAACCALLAAQLFLSSAAWGAVAQMPLLSSSGSRPKPNVMLTLDTSGSMNFRHMPEDFGGSVTRVMHPEDTYEDNTNYAGVVTANPSANDVFERKMRSPDVNTIYYNPEVLYQPWRHPDGGRYPAGNFQKAFIDPLRQASSDPAVDLSNAGTKCLARNNNGCTSSQYFNPGIYYRLTGNNVNSASSYTLYDLNAAGNPTFPKAAARTDCTGSVCTQANERQNFANWWVYYRTRMLLTKAALSEAFADMGNTVRVGWTTIARAQSSNNTIIQGVRDLSAGHRKTLLTSVQAFEATGGTPLRLALYNVGERYFKSDEPWRNDPTVSSSAMSACRRSYNLLTTDGYYNDDVRNVPVGDVDGRSFGNYTASRPYRDMANGATGYSNTLADYALRFWGEDLRTDILNNITATADDPATWQHLTQFTVGLGVTGTLNPATDLERLKSGAISWPNPGAGNAQKIDDLWHAAVNSRGAFYSAKNAGELAYAISSAIGIAGERDLREAGVITTVSTIQTNNRIYVPEYNSGVWTGDVRAYTLSADGTRTGLAWQASRAVPAEGSRNLVIWNPNSARGVSFRAANLGSTNTNTLQTAVTASLSGNTVAQLVAYVRGDTSNEGTESGQFRVRSKASENSSAPALPDFVDSNPLLVQGNVRLGYSALPTIGASYDEYLSRKASRSPVLFVGGNGGFLHAFDDNANGAEIFGFMPRGVLANLPKLARQDYGRSGGGNEHQFFVDGPLVESDAYINGGWTNVVVGTLGAGGKGIYALRIDDNNAVVNLGVNSILWDLTASTDADMGYMFSDPQVGVLPNGEWKVFIGNGFGSSSGKAVLLMIDMASGAVTKVTADNSGANGLSGVALVKNARQQVVALYAGDLKGNMWRFEYDAAAASGMRVGYGGTALFQATAPTGESQAITASPLVYSHPDGGNMVLFGTGRLIEESDRTNSSRRDTMYGVRDATPGDQSTASLSSAFATASPDRSRLTPRTIVSAGNGRYSVTGDPLTVTSLGWYMDLTIENGQRVIYPLQSLSNILLVSTVVPASAAAECSSASGTGYNFLVNVLTGSQFSRPIIDTNGDGVINSSDSAAAGYQTRSDGRDVIISNRGSTGGDGNGNDGGASSSDPPCNTTFQIHNTSGVVKGGGRACTKTVIDRVWKRVINPPTP